MAIKVYAEAGKLDANSIGITLDVDGIKNVDDVLKVVQARLSKNNQVTLWDVIVIIFAINRENKKERNK
ncbi:hypothetical protein LCGC14_0407040 [marine sediment metagenome]|uniref:Uncharacterized protein n=1 Tax=marine sediment metagenome TaxID=412755 RepID=A0A0F9T0R2_9ZZZZ